MAQTPDTGQTHPLPTPSSTADDPDAGQVIGPDGRAPVDPAAKAMGRGCLSVVLGIAVVLAIFWVLYHFFIAE